MIQQFHSWVENIIIYHPEKTIIQKDVCTPMFIETLFTIARTWKQPKCPSTEGWVKKRVFLNHKKE